MNEHIRGQLETLNQQVKELAAVYHIAASKSGVSENELWVWYALLILKGEYSQQDICDMWSLPKQTVNTIIANLTKKGYLVLEVVPGTRNRKVIRVTEEGKSYGENTVKWVYQAEQSSFVKLSEEERQMCITLMGKYINLLKDEVNDKGISGN